MFIWQPVTLVVSRAPDTEPLATHIVCPIEEVEKPVRDVDTNGRDTLTGDNLCGSYVPCLRDGHLSQDGYAPLVRDQNKKSFLKKISLSVDLGDLAR